jgi:hypothetical protein
LKQNTGWQLLLLLLVRLPHVLVLLLLHRLQKILELLNLLLLLQQLLPLCEAWQPGLKCCKGVLTRGALLQTAALPAGRCSSAAARGCRGPKDCCRARDCCMDQHMLLHMQPCSCLYISWECPTHSGAAVLTADSCKWLLLLQKFLLQQLLCRQGS